MRLDALLGRQAGLMIFGVLLLLGFGLVVARSGPLAPTKVTITQAESGSLSAALFGIGTVEARRSYFIGPTAAGRVIAVHVDVGELVKAGQLLAEIDPLDLDQRLRSLDAATARAASAVVAAEAQRKDGLARQSVAGLNAQRYRDLGAQRFVSPNAVESKQQEFTSAQAAVEASTANLQGARQEVIRLQAEQEALRQQRNNLRLRAPIDGLVTSRDAEAGSTVIAGQSVLKLVAPDSLWVKVRLDQGRSRGLAVGQTASIILRSNPALPATGKVVRIEPLSDSVTEERIALVAFDQIPAGLSIGEISEVTVHTAPQQSGLVLPNAAIKQTAQGAGVWKLQAGSPVFVAVKLGSSSLDGGVQVIEGVSAGDAIIVHSERALSAGGRVKVVDQLAGQGQ